MTEHTYEVRDLSCDHCERAVTSELMRVAGVREVLVDLGTKRVVVRGDSLVDAALREAIAAAGYEAA